uniref:Uncharacterized protein n=1 Tax=Rhizophora mucronata TaxID=61149 RepID=A0A2P2Q074_RHIMU
MSLFFVARQNKIEN